MWIPHAPRPQALLRLAALLLLTLSTAATAQVITTFELSYSNP